MNAPTNLATSSTAPPVVLSWTAGDEAVSYNIYRDFTLIANVLAPQNAYADQNVLTNSRHKYMVTAINPDGHETHGSVLDVTIEPSGQLTFQVVWIPTPGHLGPPDLQWSWG